jgi:hypothetical protein
MSHAVPGTFKHSHFGCAMCFGQLSSVGGWHTLVIITVQQQQRTWSKTLSGWHWSEPTQLASPFIKVFGKLRSLHRTDRTTVV